MYQADLAHRALRVVAGWAADGDEAEQAHATVDALAPPAGGSVLEVGFGAGRALEMLARRGGLGLIAGAEPAEPLVRAARRRLADIPGTTGLDLRCAEAVRLPFADDSFDLVYAIDACREWPDRPGALAEMAAVLKPGGELVLSIGDLGITGRLGPAGQGARMVCEAVPELRRLGLATEVEEIVHSDARGTFLVRARKAKL